MHLTKLKHHLLAVATAVAATACTSTEQKPAFSGTVETDGINEMFFNYAPDNDLMAIRTINIEPDSLGRFTFPLSPLLTLKINVLANKYPNKYPKTNFFGYFSYIRVPIMKPEAPARLPALV